MFRLWSRLRANTTRRPTALRPAVSCLEGRELPSTIISALTVTPQLLNPPNNLYQTVTVTGTVLDSNKKDVPNGDYRVVDEYKKIQPKGKLQLTPAALPGVYTFSFELQLQAKRATEYINGRHYYLLVEVSDTQNSYGKYIPILVPHNKLPVSQTTLDGPIQRLKATPAKKKG